MAVLWRIVGVRVRAAAAVLIAAGPLGMIGYGVVPILQRVDLLGIALFLAIVLPGTILEAPYAPSRRTCGAPCSACGRSWA